MTQLELRLRLPPTEADRRPPGQRSLSEMCDDDAGFHQGKGGKAEYRDGVIWRLNRVLQVSVYGRYIGSPLDWAD